MKKLIISLTLCIALVLSATAVSAAVLSPGLDIIALDMDMTVSALTGEEVTFTADQFAEAVGADSYESIKITSLPEESEGTLYYGDASVTEGQVIKEKNVSKLRFEPTENAKSASFGFTFDGAYSMMCNVIFTDKNNSAPTVLDTPPLTAFVSSDAPGEMRAVDNDGDSMYFEVVDYPRGGSVKFDSKTGEFTYTAGSRVMNDSFTYRVKDSMGNWSDTCSYFVHIIENDTDTVFSDMDDTNSVCAAVALTSEGYMSCIEDKGKMYFAPDEEVSRLDFLVAAMNVFGADKVPVIENTGFADDADIPSEYKGYVYSAAKLGIVNGVSENGEMCFKPNASITKAEASVILNSIIGYEATSVSELHGVPDWADAAVSAMYELGVYDLEGGDAKPQSNLTKDKTADMLYKVMCLLGE